MSDLINRWDAIKAVLVSNLSACTVYGRSEEGMATAKELIQVIENLPSAQPETQLSEQDATIDATSDTISRREAIEVIDAVFPVDPMKSEYKGLLAVRRLQKHMLNSCHPHSQKSSVAEIVSTGIKHGQMTGLLTVTIAP